MATSAEQSITQNAAQYRDLVTYVPGAASRTTSAYDGELRVFRAVLALGGTLPRLFFERRAAERPAGPVIGSTGTVLAAHDRGPVTYRSVFGKVVFRRHAFAAPGPAIGCPLDAELSLPGAVLLRPAARVERLRQRRWVVLGGRGVAGAGARLVAHRLQALETTVREAATSTAACYRPG